MTQRTVSRIRLDPPNSRMLRHAFHLLWIVDMGTAALLIVVPYAIELNPITVFLYGLFGLPGVALAASCYALIVVGVGHYLSHPVDLAFLIVIVAMYIFFVFNNILVLAFDYAIVSRFEPGAIFGSHSLEFRSR